jgi:AraC family transcriptional regulator
MVEASDVRCTRTAQRTGDEERSPLPTLVLPRRGVFRYQSDARTIVADANTVLLFHPDEPYRVTHPTDDGDDCTALRFDRDAVTDALGAASERAGAWFLDASAHRGVHRVASAVLAAADDLERDERALQILAVVGRAALPAPAARDAARMDAVRERLSASVGEAVSLSALARDAGLSAFHLARRFRARTGTSLHQYRLALRLGVAHARLRDGADDVTRLALDLGFSSPAHFSAAYRRAYGCRPSDARGAPTVPAYRRRLPGGR